MASSITLKFKNLPDINTEIVIIDTFLGNILEEHFVNQRLQPSESTRGYLFPQTASLYMDAFNADYNATGLYTVALSLNSESADVTIIGNNPLSELLIVLNSTNGAVEIIENNVTPPTPFYIDSLQFLPATQNNSCSHYKVSVTTNEQASKIFSPIYNDNLDGSNINPIVFEVLRGQGFILDILHESGQTIKQKYAISQVPSILNKSLFSLKINNSPNGATVIVNSENINLLDLEYSLDNTNWKTENVFSGLLPDNFILYIRDHLGCSISIDFNVNDENIYTSRSYYSKTNSIIMVEQNNSDYKTEENTLSNKSFAINPKLAHPEYHLFKNTHIIPCQLLSNYSNIVAKVIKEDGSEDNLFVNKITYNIGRKDARDAIKYNVGFGKTGIYFNTGKLYDYDTDTYTNSDYSLLGGLPEWAKIGNYFSVDGAWFKIENKYFDDNLGVESIIIDSVYTGNPTSIITKSIFNRQKDDVFEWVIDMSVYNNQTIQIQTIETDDRFVTKTRISEKILVKPSHKDMIEIISYNTKNTDVFYKSGIKHYALVHTASISGEHEDPSEINKGDDASSLIDSKLYESLDYEFDLLSLGGYRQLTRMLSNNMVFIESVQCIKNGSVEKEGPLGESNAYKLKAKMMYANGGLNTNASEIELITENENFDVPNLKITDAGKYVTYQ
ncbi:hypothetical protein [uncultured Wocania sp.]|uniref:hypothetical protein n=1 Tax=uncultured Wocania sp. TaxID=2834404 RepID=UPI0030F94D5E